jgi:hypothetical protein
MVKKIKVIFRKPVKGKGMKITKKALKYSPF